MLFLLNVGLVWAQETDVQPLPTDIPSPEISITYLTCGPYFYELRGDTGNYHAVYADDSDIKDQLFYRVSLVLEEIYYSIMIEKISRGLEEGDPVKIVSKYFYSGFEVCKNLECRMLTDVKFIKWKAFNTFLVKENEQFIEMIINKDGSLIIQVIALET